VQLITHAVGATSHDKTLGRAEALRRAMLAMIDKGEPRQAHPAYWAPFVVVGEGGASVATRPIVGGAPTQERRANRRATGKDVGDWTAETWKRQSN
jgi:hypothetical protein